MPWALGADVAINYKTQDFVEDLKARAIAPDVILDMVGGDYVARNLRCIAMHGRIVNIAFQKGSKVEVDLLARHGEAPHPDRINCSVRARWRKRRKLPGHWRPGSGRCLRPAIANR